MSVQPNNTDAYCDASDVARYFRTLEDSDGFSFDTNPSKAEVDEFILEATARVDRETGTAWRERQVVEEYHDLEGIYYYWAGTPIKLMKRKIRTPLDSAKGDKLEFWDGNQWEDWVTDSTMTEGRDGDYWFNDTTGMLYVYRRSWWWERYQSIRVTYRYGEDVIPKDIQQATALFTAAALIETDIYGDLLPTGGDAPSPGEVSQRLEERAEKMLNRRKEVRTIGNP